MSIKNSLLPLALLFFSLQCPAQNSELELRKKVQTQNDTAQITAYLELGKYYYTSTGKGDSVVLYATKALTQSRKLGDKKKEISSLIDLGTGHMLVGDTELAKEELFMALNYAEKLKDLKALANVHNKLGNLYSDNNEHQKGIVHFIKSIKNAKEIGDYNQLCASYYAISLIYVELNQADKQIFYTLKALRVADSENVKDNCREIVFNSSAQLFLVNTKKNPVYLDSAEIYANKGLHIVETNQWNYRKPSYLNLLCAVCYKKKEFNKSLELGLESLELLKTNGGREDLKVNLNLIIAQIYSKKNNKGLAYSYLQAMNESPLVADDYYGKSFAKVSYEIYLKFGDLQLALEALEKKGELDAKTYEANRTKMINELETKYHSELKDVNIVKLNQQKKIDALEIQRKRSQIAWLFGLVSLILMVLTVIIFVFRHRSAKRNLQILETEQRLNRARMNPHFFFNALTSIQTLTLKEKDLESTMYLAKFSKLMRQSLDSTFDEMISIEDEMEFIGHYIELQKLRHPGLFDFSINCDEKLDMSEVMMPGMILQPFIENAIEHGFKGMTSGGKLSLEFNKVDDSLHISLKDNGIVIKEAESKESKHVSRAIGIITDRLFLLKKKTHKVATFEILRMDGKIGCQIKLTLPILFQ